MRRDGPHGPFRSGAAASIIGWPFTPVATNDATVMQQILDLLDAPTSGAEAPSLARMEDTLTDGYAQALALEAERWRLERRLAEVAGAVGGTDGAGFAEELSALAGRLTAADGELSQLRTMLGTLHERARVARFAAKR
jgi:hypothetical protein